MDRTENVKTFTDNETYQDWMAKGSKWNEEKSIYMFNFKCPTSGDLGNYFTSGKCALTLTFRFCVGHDCWHALSRRYASCIGTNILRYNSFICWYHGVLEIS